MQRIPCLSPVPLSITALEFLHAFLPTLGHAQLSQGLSTKSPLPSSPSSMSSAPFVCSIQFVLSVSPSFRVRPSRVVALLLPFDRCRRRRVVSSLSRSLFHFLVTFVWPLETLRGSAPSVCARARCPRPSSRRLSVRSTVAACNHPPCVAHAFVSMLSCLQFLLAPPSSSPGGHLPGPLHQIAYHFDDGTDNIKGLTDSKEGGKLEFLKN